jgi:hypothetical protein
MYIYVVACKGRLWMRHGGANPSKPHVPQGFAEGWNDVGGGIGDVCYETGI